MLTGHPRPLGTFSAAALVGLRSSAKVPADDDDARKANRDQTPGEDSPFQVVDLLALQTDERQ